MANTITVELVTVDGLIDQNASTEAFESALVKRVAEMETQTEVIAEALSAIFAENLGKKIAMPVLGSLVAQRLNAKPESYATVQGRAMQYVRDNSQTTGNEEDGTLVEHPDSEFVIVKGKGGGCGKRRDLPVKAAK